MKTDSVLVVLVDGFEAGFELDNFSDFCSVVGNEKYRKIIAEKLELGSVYVAVVENVNDAEQSLAENEEITGRKFKEVICPDSKTIQQRLNKLYASRN